jgi:hypothetical protein
VGICAGFILLGCADVVVEPGADLALKRRLASLENSLRAASAVRPSQRRKLRPPLKPQLLQARKAIAPMYRNPIFLALDVPRLDAAQQLARKVSGHIGGMKLGLEFFCAHGHHGVHELAKLGLPIFLDLKLHDIPNTVAAAMQAIHVLEPAIVTVHASGGGR